MKSFNYHVRDCAPNTNVMQDHGVITSVKTLAERIVWARERKGLTQGALAAKAGVAQGTIGNLESGARKSPRALLAIAAVLGVDPRWLETGRGSIETPHSAFVSDVLADYGGKVVDPVDREALASVVLNLGTLLTQMDERSRRMMGVLLSDLALSPDDSADIARRAADIAASDANRSDGIRVTVTPGEGYHYQKMNPLADVDLPTDSATVSKKRKPRE